MYKMSHLIKKSIFPLQTPDGKNKIAQIAILNKQYNL